MKYLWILLFFFALFFYSGFAQQQQIADSLREVYEADTLKGVDKMDLLKDLAFHEKNDLDLSVYYAEELIAMALKAGDYNYLYDGNLQKGNTFLLQNNLDESLEAYQKAQEYAQLYGDKIDEVIARVYQGNVYYESGEPERAIIKLTEGIAILRDPAIQEQEDGSYLLAAVLFNLGELYLKENDLENAGKYHQEAGEIYQLLGDSTGINYVLGNQGVIYAKLGNYRKAEEHLTKAIRLMEEDKNYDPISEYQITLAEVYKEEGEYTKAHLMATEGLEHAQQRGFKELISRASKVLAELDYQSGNFKEAYEHQAMHNQYKDSMDVETVDMNRLERAQAELEALQANMQKRRQETALWATGASALLLIFLVLGIYGRYRYMHKTNKIISVERDRSEELLLNILPKETAQELKDNGHVLAKRFDSVTVLFTDFKGFTAHAESLDPEKLVESIDLYFSNFDAIMEKHGLEKIKTVGDAYMCASGLPFPSEDHAHRMAEAALELIEFVEEAKTKAPDDLIHFDIRVGINSGPVVAGVVGTKKFAYDIWGDTVNIASRMESASEAGRINIAEETYQLLKDDYECEYRGKIDVKNRGKLNMYFMLGRKAQSKTA